VNIGTDGGKEMSKEIALQQIRIKDPFWSGMQEKITDTVIPFQERVLNDKEEGVEKSHALDNFRIAAGLERQDSGKAERPDRLGFVFQEDRLIGCLNALGNLAIAGADPCEAYETLKAFRFTDELIFKPSETLSGGEKRRAAIARALLCGAGDIILDEPFKGIDDETLREYILPQVKCLTEGKTVLMITHSAEEAGELCSRTVDISKNIDTDENVKE